MIRTIKIRHVAYFLGSCLVLFVVLNYWLVQKVAIKPNQMYVLEYVVQTRELSQQLHYALKTIIQQDFYNEKIAEGFEKIRIEYQKHLSLLETGGSVLENQQVIRIPAPPDNAQPVLNKIKTDWNSFIKDTELVFKKLQVGSAEENAAIDTDWLEKKYENFLTNHKILQNAYRSSIEERASVLNYSLLLIGLFGAILVIGIYFSVRNLVLVPIGQISRSSRLLAKGNLSQKIPYDSRTEIGYIAKNINELADILQNATNFSKEIGRGNLDAEYKGSIDALDNKDSIIAALQSMRDQLRNVSEKDRQERWTSAGLAQFGDVLRNADVRNMQELCYSIISTLVDYLDAHQGIIYILNDDKPGRMEHYLESQAYYAASKRKHVQRVIEIGDTLLGQSYLDRETIFLDNVPDNYEKITSGLGGSLPKNVLIVPIKGTEGCLGIIELLSLKPLAAYHVQFVEKIAESTFSSIASAKAFEKQKKLFVNLSEEEKRLARRS